MLKSEPNENAFELFFSRWDITSAPGTRILFVLREFYLTRYGSLFCDSESLKVYSGINSFLYFENLLMLLRCSMLIWVIYLPLKTFKATFYSSSQLIIFVNDE